jgi:hypothetical protein
VLRPGAWAKRAPGNFFLVVVHGRHSAFVRPKSGCEPLRKIRRRSQRGIDMTALDGQFALLIDTINDAIRDTVRALGPKMVAQALFPAKKPEAAERYLDDCLNPGREQKLSIDEILVIARMGREKGIHLIATYINRDVGYTDPCLSIPRTRRPSCSASSMRTSSRSTSSPRASKERAQVSEQLSIFSGYLPGRSSDPPRARRDDPATSQLAAAQAGSSRTITTRRSSRR